MLDLLKEIVKQPYWVALLVVGAILTAVPCVNYDKGHFTTHPPTTVVLVVTGALLLFLSAAAFVLDFVQQRKLNIGDAGSGLDLTRVRDDNGVLWTKVGGCEIRVVQGRLEDPSNAGAALVLPCNEYFDDRCVDDTRSALGAYVNKVFAGQVSEFARLVGAECRVKFGPGIRRQKTSHESAESFGPGRCLFILQPLGRTAPLALVSTTTQRAGEGLSARISYLFEAMRELVAHLADARLNEVAMPVLGAGHGGIDPPLALVGLLLATAEAARYGQGAQRLRRVSIVVFQKDANSAPEVDPVVVRRALALIGSGD